MPFADAKYPPPPRSDEQVRELMAVLEPFAYLCSNPLDLDMEEDDEWTIANFRLADARMVFCRVAVALRLPGYGGDA
jgi:hypothetical protein